MANVNDVASYIISLRNYDAKKGDKIFLNNLKLQKFLYYCQGGHFQLHGEPLFIEPLEAWLYGPTSPKVYGRFSRCGQNSLPDEEGVSYTLNETEKKTIDEVWNRLKKVDMYTLVRAAQIEEPWLKAFHNARDKTIPLSAIEDQFVSNKQTENN